MGIIEISYPMETLGRPRKRWEDNIKTDLGK
jgi:hypothetical protein